MAYGTNNRSEQGPLTAQDVQDVTLPGFSKGESPHNNHPGTTFIDTSKKNSIREGHLTQTDHNNSSVIDQINAMSWLDKMEMFNRAAFLEFLQTLSVKEDDYEDAKQESDEKIIQLIQRNNEAMDARRLKEYLEDFELRAQRSIIDDWEKTKRLAIWYQQVIAKQYLDLFNIHNEFVVEFQSVLQDVISDESFNRLPSTVQEKVLSADGVLSSYLEEDNSEELRILSEDCLNYDGSINQESQIKKEIAIEKIKQKIQRVNDAYSEVYEAIRPFNVSKANKLKSAKARFDQEAAPLLLEIQKFEALQNSISLGINKSHKDTNSRCIRAVEDLRAIEYINPREPTNSFDGTKREIQELRTSITKAVTTMLDVNISPRDYQEKLLLIQRNINSFRQQLLLKPEKNMLERKSLVAIEILREDLLKVISRDERLVSAKESRQEDILTQENSSSDEPTVSTFEEKPVVVEPVEHTEKTEVEQYENEIIDLVENKPSLSVNDEQTCKKNKVLKDRIKSIAEETEQLSQNCCEQETIDNGESLDTATLKTLMADLKTSYMEVYAEYEDTDFNEITLLLTEYEKKEINSDNLSDFEELLLEKIGQLDDDDLTDILKLNWNEIKDSFTEEYSLSSNRPGL